MNKKYNIKASQEAFEIHPLACMNARHRCDIYWRTCTKIPAVLRIVAEAMDNRAIRSISELTDMLHTRLFVAPQRKNLEEINQMIWETKRPDQ